MYQTTANSNAFVMGSCRVAIPTSTAGYFRLGAARGVKVTESWEWMEVETDNTPKIEIGAKKQVITVEGNLLELDFQRLSAMRGGIGAWSSANYRFDSGGDLTITPQALYLTHTGASTGETVVITVYYASLIEGLSIPFPGDDKTDVAEIPFKFKGVCQSTRTVGSQLFNIVDTRTGVYSTTYFSTSI